MLGTAVSGRSIIVMDWKRFVAFIEIVINLPFVHRVCPELLATALNGFQLAMKCQNLKNVHRRITSSFNIKKTPERYDSVCIK